MGQHCSTNAADTLHEDVRRHLSPDTFDGVPEGVLIAGRRLRLIDGKLVLQFGVVCVLVLRSVLIEGVGPKKIATRLGDKTQRGCDFYARFLREALGELAIITGFAAIPRAPALPLRAWAASAVIEAVQEKAG
jgi:hypothetical protein